MEILMKILYVVLGILAFFLLPPLIVVSLARIAGMMAALRGSSPDVLNSLEPRVKFWSGGLILWTFGLCGSFVAYMVFEAPFLIWIWMIFAGLASVTFTMFIIDARFSYEPPNKK